MSLDTFKAIFHKLPDTLTQIAFGVDATATANPDLIPMMEYARSQGVVPNITVADVNLPMAYKLANLCGGVAVSRYDDKSLCYGSVSRLRAFGMKQVVIHQMLSKETFDNAIETIYDFHRDERLKGLKAIVFLSLKQKGRGKKHNSLSKDQFAAITQAALSMGVPIGFDSCSASKFGSAIDGHAFEKRMLTSTEPCESTCFSLYINVKGEYFPCSFTEAGDFSSVGDWKQGINMLEIEDFMRDIWNHQRTNHFRGVLIKSADDKGLRSCPLYQI